MDFFWIPTIVSLVVMATMFICIMLCVCAKRRNAQGTVYSTPVVVTTTTHEPIGTGVQGTPYPVQTGQIIQQTHPYPVTVNYTAGPMPGAYATHTTPYPPTAYPQQGQYPMQHNQAPVIGFVAVPPPYTEVAPNVQKESYPQQSSYNPNY